MQATNKNNEIIGKLFEDDSLTFENSDSLWKVADGIEAPSLIFRIVRVFTYFHSLFPKSLEEWYFDQTKKVIKEFRVNLFVENRKNISDDTSNNIYNYLMNQGVINSEIYKKVKELITISKALGEAKVDLIEQKWTADEIKLAIEKFYYQNKNNQISNIPEFLTKACAEIRKGNKEKVLKAKIELMEQAWTEDEINLAIEKFYQKKKEEQITNIPEFLTKACRKIRKEATKEPTEKKEEWLTLLKEKEICELNIKKFENSRRFQPVFQGKGGNLKEELNELTLRMSCLDLIEQIETTFVDKMDKSTLSALNQKRALLLHYPNNLTEEHLSALNHIGNIIEELKSTDSDETVQQILKIVLKMTSYGLREETLEQYMDLREAMETKNNQKEKAVKVREKITSLYGKIENESLAYELVHVLGSDIIPPTTFLKGKGYQRYIPNATTLNCFLQTDKKAAEKISTIDLTEVQAHLTFGIILSRSDGHGYNTIITNSKNGKVKFHNIDEEEDLICQNLKISKTRSDEGGHGCHKDPVMGFPQAGKPYSRLLLKLFSWNGIKKNALNQMKRRGLDKSSLEALEQRLDKIIEVCRFESEKEAPTLTPRDIYFMIYGKDFLYEKVKEQGYSDYEFFVDGVKLHDDEYPKKKKESSMELESTIDKNMRMLDSKNETDFSMDNKKDEQYCGQKLLKSISYKFDKYEKMEIMEIDLKAFEKENWEKYKQNCIDSKKPIKYFMFSHFIKGYAKRMTRQISHLYPKAQLEIVEKNNRCYLEMTNPNAPNKQMLSYGEFSKE
jgi:hypothetical protein